MRTFSYKEVKELVGLDDHELTAWSRSTTGYLGLKNIGKGQRREFSFDNLVLLVMLKSGKQAGIAPGSVARIYAEFEAHGMISGTYIDFEDSQVLRINFNVPTIIKKLEIITGISE